MSPTSETAVVVRRQGRIGRLTLDRPKALNAIDRGMIRTIHHALDSWRDDPAVDAVVIESSNARAFCAGGDIRWLRDMTLAGDYAEVDGFFSEEYALNLAIARYPKPYVALIDGVCMGGGIGLSVHGSIRVVSDAASLAMPETSIGFFPDVGASYILPRLRPGFGMYLGLTGARVTAADAMFLGLATHYVGRDEFGGLADAIAEDGLAVLSLAAAPSPRSALAGLVDAIRCFDTFSVAEIFSGLAALDSDWAQETLTTLRAMSPSAVLWSFELMRRGRSQTLEQCLMTELALSRLVSRHPDLQEGVRAMVIDKDRKPRWSPMRLENVDNGVIASMFSERFAAENMNILD